MVERVSALAAVYEPGTAGSVSAEGPRVRLREIRGLRIAQIAVWPESLERVRTLLAAANGGRPPPGPGRWIPWGSGAGACVLRVEPLKWWLLGTAAALREAPPPPELAPGDGAGLDLSHARTGIRIGGPQAAELLMRFMPLDLRPAQFSRGAAATGQFGHGSAVVLRVDRQGKPEYRLLLHRSYAEFGWTELVESAAQFGCEILPAEDG